MAAASSVNDTEQPSKFSTNKKMKKNADEEFGESLEDIMIRA